jgi:hypothetical protein
MPTPLRVNPFIESVMETTLHKQLKEHYAGPNSEIEVRVDGFIIDIVDGKRLIEIQRSGLSSIRDKIKKLLKNKHKVEVVKPLVARKRLVKLSRKNGKVIDRRWSPKTGCPLDMFEELLYFTRVFPHPNLKLICPLVEIEEIRYPGHGRRRRRRANDFQVKDRTLTSVEGTATYRTIYDLHKLLPKTLPTEFDTGELAEGLGVKRFVAQRIGYCLRKTGSAKQVGKRGNAIVYQLAKKSARNSTAAKPSRKKATKRKTTCKAA